MIQRYTIIPISDFILNQQCVQGHSHQRTDGSFLKKSYLLAGLLLVFTLALNGQALIPLDDYLTKIEKDDLQSKPGQPMEQTSSQAEVIRSQLFDLHPSVYWLDGKVSLHQTGLLVRMVTTAQDLPGVSDLSKKMSDELISVKTLIIKIPDEKAMRSIRESDLDIYQMMPSLERVFFILEYEADTRATRGLERKLPKLPENPAQNQSEIPERKPVLFLYKISIPA